nr:hypothetical protein [Pseudomonas benzenivorans]
MDTLTKLISTIEIAIRYLLTGAVVSAVVTLSCAEYWRWFAWAAENEAMTAIIVTAVGFVAFTLYRLVLWTAGDAIAWKLGWSVPSLLHRNGKAYDEPYAHFLKWRYSGAVGDALGGYLAFRWAVAHFASVSGVTLFAASLLNQEASWVSEYAVSIGVLGVACFSLGFWQCAFFYRVERNLCSSMPQPKE